MGFLSWEIWVAFPRESQLQQSHATQPMGHARCFSVSIIHQTLTWTTGSLTCTQMLMHVIAHVGVWTPIRQSALKLKLTLGEKSLAAPGDRTCVSSMPVRFSTNWATSPPSFWHCRTIWSCQPCFWHHDLGCNKRCWQLSTMSQNMTTKGT